MQHAPYKIDNLSNVVGVSYAQTGNNSMESCPMGEERHFAWKDQLEKNFMLKARFFIQKSAIDMEWISEAKDFSIDILNSQIEVLLQDKARNVYKVYISVYTNEFQKVLEISDEPSKNIFETEKAKTDDEELKEGEESKTVSQTSDDHNDTQLEISRINVSLIKENMEVITVVLDNLTAIIREKKSEIIYCVNLDRL